MSGKGDMPRPLSISRAEFRKRFDAIFRPHTDDHAVWVICVDNAGHEASLEIGKRYRAIYELDLARQHQLRVEDESGEYYIYPQFMFGSAKNV